jgi:hypothetical protein
MSHSVGWLVGMSSNLRPFSFKFISGKRKNHKGQDQVCMDNTGMFFGPKTLEWKGRCEQEQDYFHGKEMAFSPTSFP